MKTILQKVLKVFTSRTVWAVIILFLVNGISGIRELIPPDWLPVVDAVLGLLIIYFRIRPKVKF